MSDTTIAMRYASALFEAVGEDDAARSRVRADLTALAGALDDPALAGVVDNPRVAAADKAAVLDRLAERAGAGDTSRRLVKVLVDHGRARLLGAVGDAFGRLVDAAQGRQAVTVTAAYSLPAPLKTTLESRIQALVGGEAEITHRVDPATLGGLVVQIGSKVFDNSIRNHLSHMRQTI